MVSGTPEPTPKSNIVERLAAMMEGIMPAHIHEAVTHAHPATYHEEPYGLTVAEARKGLSGFARVLVALTAVGSPLGGFLTASAGPETAGVVVGGLTVISWVLVEAFHVNLGAKLAIAAMGRPTDA
jgi:hypothetical protein